MAIAVVPAAVYAQTPPAQPGTVIRATTRLVEVHVVARDAQGRPVTDLRSEDFRVFDDGADRSVASFSIDAASAQSEMSVATRNPAPSVNNRRSQGATGYSAILLDWLNSSFSDRLRGDDAVRNVLSTIPVRQLVAIYALGTEPPNSKHPLALFSNFSDSSADIASIINDPLILRGPDLAESHGIFDARYSGSAQNVSVQQQVFDWDNRIMDTVRALSDLADRMARLPGRKSVIWLTTGFPAIIDAKVIPGIKTPEGIYLKEIDRVLARFNQLNIAVHTVNTKGLSASGGRSYDDTLKEFADRTGGTMFSDRNDIETGVRVALEDMHDGYTLGFLVPDGAAAGMHRIRVRTSKRNVNLAYRESYDLSK